MSKPRWLHIAFRIIKNKYIITIVIFVLIVVFFDNNNLLDRYTNLQKLHQLEKDKDYFLQRIKEDSKRMNELKTDTENLEKFAREQYLMKKKDEDIFIIQKEKK